jgi:hypothetical protein
MSSSTRAAADPSSVSSSSPRAQIANAQHDLLRSRRKLTGADVEETLLHD